MLFKRIKINKKVTCLLFIFLLNINSFSAIVSDNDGSAFITKAEFDSLKNNFQSQLDSYNSSIDNKIDNAIASYLAGISVSRTPVNLWNEVLSINGGPIWFLNELPGVGADAININKKITLRRQLNAYGVWNWTESWKYWSDTPSSHYYGTGIVVLYSVAGENSTTVETGTQWRIYQTRLSVDRRDNTGMWSTRDTNVPLFPYDGSGGHGTWWSESTFRDIGLVNKYKSDISALNSNEVDGSGSGYIYHINPDGSTYISEYASIVYPVINIHAYVHNYQSFKVPNSSSESRGTTAQNNFIKWYTTDNGKAYTTTTMQTYDAALPVGYGSSITSNTSGLIPSDTSTDDNKYYIKVDLSKITTTDNVDYNTKQFARYTDTQVYCMRDIALPVESTTEYDNIDVTNITWQDIYFSNVGQNTQTNKMNDVRVRWKKLSMAPERRPLHAFTNSVLTSVAGKDVYNGGGVPVAKIINDTSATMKIKFKSSSGSGSVYYQISNKQFIDGSFDSSASISEYGTANVSDEITITKDFLKDDIVWINCYSTINGVEATIDNFNIV